jgi:DNA-directed RNA polymerase subunit M/transcription elongation factor TFIIS
MTDIISKFSKDAETIASRIERSCYNKAIDQCKSSSESYVRQWDSSMWINVYSAKTGIIFTYIDPESTVVKKYGNIIYKILSNEINMDDIGYMSEHELCPIANEHIRADITRRMNQKVEVKTTNMFKCPKCGTRDAEYKEVQLRGIDEPTTYKCKCNKCKTQFNG